MASCHHDIRVKGVVMGVWQQYIAVRRSKLYLKRVAMGCHTSSLLLKCFSTWKAQFARSREMAEFEDLILLKSRLATCRRAMARWKFCILC